MKKLVAVALAGACALAGMSVFAQYGYVDDGLVAHWDAIDNQATGTHVDGAATWVDLVGGSRIDLKDVTWEDDALYFPGSVMSGGVFADNSVIDHRASGLTIEVVARIEDTGTYAALFSGPTYDAAGGTGYAAANSPVIIRHTDKSYFYTRSVNECGMTPALGDDFGTATVNWSAGGWLSQSAIYLNGEKANKPSGAKTPSFTIYNGHAYLGRLASTGVGALKGRIYSVRVYKRTLSAAEALQNYTADVARFNRLAMVRAGSVTVGGTTYGAGEAIVGAGGVRALAIDSAADAQIELGPLAASLSVGAGSGGEVTLGYAAFHYCQFARATVGARVKVLSSQLFSNCFSLEEVVLPETLERIEERAFYMNQMPEYGILDLREKMTVTPLLPSALTYLGHYAFVRAKLAGDLVVPGGVAFDGSHNFSENLPLASATFGEGTEALPDGLFELCAGLKTVRLPKDVTTIVTPCNRVPLPWRTRQRLLCAVPPPRRELALCEFLMANEYDQKLDEKVAEFLPPTVTFVGHEAFRGCSSLGGVLRLGQKHEVSLIHAMEYSGHAFDHQFNEMSALTDVVFGKGVKAIGRVMFQDSLSLRNVTFAVWPTVASDVKYSSFYFDPGKGCNYTVLFKLPRGDARAEAFIASAHVKKWADCTEAEVAGFAASHPGERPPIGLTVGSDPMEVLPSDNGVPFLPPNQWVTYAPSVGMQLLFR